MTRYEPADSLVTPRFSGVRTFMRLPNVQDLENADAAIVGAPFDTGSSFRVGALARHECRSTEMSTCLYSRSN